MKRGCTCWRFLRHHGRALFYRMRIRSTFLSRGDSMNAESSSNGEEGALRPGVPMEYRIVKAWGTNDSRRRTVERLLPQIGRS